VVFCSNNAPYIVHVPTLLIVETVYVFEGVCVVSLHFYLKIRELYGISALFINPLQVFKHGK